MSTITDETRAKRAAYMRQWNASNGDKVRAKRRENSAQRKVDEDAHRAFRESANARNRRYAKAHADDLKARAKAKNHGYTPERGAMLRNRYGVQYATQVSLKSARLRATKKGLPFDLTTEWYDAEFAKGCAVTGIPLDPNGSKTPWTAHVDRVEPKDGYLMANCRLVCACFNLAKKHWTDADVLRMARALVRNADA